MIEYIVAWSVPVKLQHVQNSAMQNITTMKCSNHVTVILADLHWLLVKYLLQYKVAVTDLHIYNLDAVPPVHVVSNHVVMVEIIQYGKSSIIFNRLNSGIYIYKFNQETSQNKMFRHVAQFQIARHHTSSLVQLTTD